MKYYAVIDTNAIVSSVINRNGAPGQIMDAYLVTGNIRHFPVRSYIVTPKQMLDIIEQNNNKCQ